MDGDRAHLDTLIVHAGEPEPRIEGAATPPIFQSTVFLSVPGAPYHDIRYPRLNNLPNHQILHAKLAALEECEAALVASSGMAAISTTLLTLLESGDHVLLQDCLYGGTHTLVTTELSRLGILFDFVDGADPEEWQRKLRPSTRVFYTEALTNPTLRVADHERVVSFARTHRLTTVIDATFVTPVNWRPVTLGYDLVVHSATKYLNGHSDLVAGVVAGSEELVSNIKRGLDHFGGTLDPHACYLLHRGLKTLALRVRHQNASALAIARFLSSHRSVARVHYPGLESHPGHERARKLLSGFGGMLSFELADAEKRTDAFLERLRLPLNAPSLGGTETLVTRPAATSHGGMPRPDRLARGITDSLIRMSVGIEHVDDLIADIEEALRD